MVLLSLRRFYMRESPPLPFIGNMSFAVARSLSVSPQCRVLPSHSVRPEKKRATFIKSFAGAHAGAVSRPQASSSLYEVLQLKNDATDAEIKRAYRRLAKLYHPDTVRQSSSDCRDFIEIHHAYATLSDPSARSVYDLSLKIQWRQRSTSIRVENPSQFYQSRNWETDQCW